ncbi:MAG: dihydroxyacetone kinase subunit L [Sphaerochaetaceae bacterium]
MSLLQLDDFKAIFTKLNEMAQANRDYLIELDSVMGDGDLGLTMAAIFKAGDEFAQSYTDDDIGSMLMKGGMVMAKAAPSTMGTLMATGFMRGGKALRDKTEISLNDMALFWRTFTDGIAERGKSKVGEKTILDSLDPAATALENSQAPLKEAFIAAKEAANKGVEATKDMVAQHGRAAYYQEKSRTVQDPGATVGALIVAVFADYIAKMDN